MVCSTEKLKSRAVQERRGMGPRRTGEVSGASQTTSFYKAKANGRERSGSKEPVVGLQRCRAERVPRSNQEGTGLVQAVHRNDV